MCGVTVGFGEQADAGYGLSPRVRGHHLLKNIQGVGPRSIPACAGSPVGLPADERSVGVYPRVCGVTEVDAGDSLERTGLSPRVRGHHYDLRDRHEYAGSIPACAGSPLLKHGRCRIRKVYPRVCGVTDQAGNNVFQDEGLSPRVRGHLLDHGPPVRRSRSIPACAGSPISRRAIPNQVEVYPRVCGVTPDRGPLGADLGGLSPRVRGHQHLKAAHESGWRSIPACAGSPTAAWTRSSMRTVYPRVCGVTKRAPFSGNAKQGLSPRVRGHPRGAVPERVSVRSIPACAGSPPHPARGGWPCAVYPRVCGVTPVLPALREPVQGLSPRVRGHPRVRVYEHSIEGSIPACAGSPQGQTSIATRGWVYPRVCGVTRFRCRSELREAGLSPRVRGHLDLPAGLLAEVRSIPACAGSPPGSASEGPSRRVYPRVCGVTQSFDLSLTADYGLSPRVRGHQTAMGDFFVTARSIPACAGSPLVQFVRNRALRAHRSVYRSERATVCRRATQKVWRVTASPAAT